MYFYYLLMLIYVTGFAKTRLIASVPIASFRRLSKFFVDFLFSSKIKNMMLDSNTVLSYDTHI